MPHPAPLAVVAFAAYVLGVSQTWEVPAPGGLPFGPSWLACSGGVAITVRVWRGRFEAPWILVGAVVVAMILNDLTALSSQPLRDFHLYLRAGERFVAGTAVYLEAPLTAVPSDRSLYPFLYPPLALPLFAGLAALPRTIVDLAWLSGSLAAVLGTLRLFDLPVRWWPVFLAWPPVFDGLFVGNVAGPLVLLFAAAPLARLGGGLVVAGIFKLYGGLASAWLIRERRLVDLAGGLAIVLGLVLLTSPITGIERWRAWLDGLARYRDSQELLPAWLYGLSLFRYLPFIVAVGLAVLAVALALRAGGRPGLARFGVATVVGSPSLFSHGFIVALPAFLALEPASLWLALGITSVAPGPLWWVAIGMVVLAWRVPALRLGRAPTGGLHPLAAGDRRWLTAGRASGRLEIGDTGGPIDPRLEQR